MERQKRKSPRAVMSRRYRSRGVDVEIREAKDHLELSLDGIPIHVSVLDGKYHCHLANHFMAFGTIDQVVDRLLSTEGRLWTLHGHVCDERCGPSGHHNHGGAHGRGHHARHDHGKPGHGNGGAQ